MKSLLNAYKTLSIPSNSDQMQQLVGESTAALIHLVLNTRVERDYIIDDRKDGLLSVDGPQCLAFIEYIQVTLSSQQAVFNLTGSIFMKQVDLDYNSIVGGHSDVSLIDGTIICATLLRAANPWTIEFFPNVFKSLFQACGNSVESFGVVLRCSSDIRLCNNVHSLFGAVQPGKKLAGFFFDVMKTRARDDFLLKAMKICQKEDIGKWRNMKVLLKANCGKFSNAAMTIIYYTW